MIKTKRISDTNGFLEVKDNPITKEGVFPYSGAQIGAPDSGKIYMVYRPAEELQKPETIESFKLLPFINEHEMLGDGFTPAERKGVQGVVGGDVHFDEPYLKGTIKIFGENLKDAIRDGKLELSAGYRCKYEFSQGEWNGHHYDAIQREIRGNHLALVEQGRSGPDVRVMDDMTITFDERELFMDEEKAMSSSDDRIAAIEEKIDKLMSFMEKLKPVEEAEHGQSFDDDSEEAPAVAESAPDVQDDDVAEPAKPDVSEDLGDAPCDIKKAASDCGLDADNPEVMKAFEAGMNYGKEDAQDEAPEEEKAEEKAEAMDEAVFVQRMAKRDAMAKKLSQHVGSFACDAMTLQQVAEYGVKKLHLEVPKGSEIVAMDAWLAGRDKPAKTVKPVMDGLLSAGSKKIDEFYK